MSLYKNWVADHKRRSHWKKLLHRDRDSFCLSTCRGWRHVDTWKYCVTTIKGNFTVLCQIDGGSQRLQPGAYNLPILQQYITLPSLLISSHSILNTLDSLQHSGSCKHTEPPAVIQRFSLSRNKQLVLITLRQLKLICQPCAHNSRCGILLIGDDIHDEHILLVRVSFHYPPFQQLTEKKWGKKKTNKNEKKKKILPLLLPGLLFTVCSLPPVMSHNSDTNLVVVAFVHCLRPPCIFSSPRHFNGIKTNIYVVRNYIFRLIPRPSRNVYHLHHQHHKLPFFFFF